MASTTAERLARVETLLQELVRQSLDAGESRKRIYETQERAAREILLIKGRLDQVERGLEAIRPTTEEYERLRDHVTAAGRIGRWLWQLGKLILSAAAGAAAAYYSLTGRPPP